MIQEKNRLIIHSDFIMRITERPRWTLSWPKRPKDQASIVNDSSSPRKSAGHPLEILRKIPHLPSILPAGRKVRGAELGFPEVLNNGVVVAQDAEVSVVSPVGEAQPTDTTDRRVGIKPSTGKFLAGLSQDSDRERERYRSYTFNQYIEGLLEGDIPRPYLNAGDLLYTALSTPPPEQVAAGLELPALSSNGDEFDVYGQYIAKEAIYRYFGAARETGGKDRGLLIVGPPGSGKTVTVEAIKRAVERHTKKQNAAPIFAIEGCPIQEDPLRLLNSDERRVMKEEHGIAVTGHLCPHCERVLEECGHDRGVINVKAVPFSIKQGRCLGRLDPELTHSKNPEDKELLSQIKLKSNRGLLTIEELCRHSKEFRLSLNDFIRGRTMQYNGEIYELDTIIVASTTLDEWNKLSEDKEFASFVKRWEVVEVTYLLSRSREADIYRKALRESNVKTYQQYPQPPESVEEDARHVSQRMIEAVAEISTRSRYRGSANLKLERDEKIKLYDGLNVGKTPQQRREIEETGRKNREGFSGISPDEMKERFFQLVVQAQNCLSPITALIQLREDFLRLYKDQPSTGALKPPKHGSTLSLGEEYAEYVDEALATYLEWGKDVLKQEFRGEETERDCNKLWNIYLEHARAHHAKEEIWDPTIQKWVAPDVKFLAQVEDMSFPDQEIGPETRQALRGDAVVKDASIGRHGEPSNFKTIPEFEKGILRMVTGSSEKPQEILASIASPNPDQQKRLREVQERLIKNHGCCPSCAHDLMVYAANHRFLEEDKGKK